MEIALTEATGTFEKAERPFNNVHQILERNLHEFADYFIKGHMFSCRAINSRIGDCKAQNIVTSRNPQGGVIAYRFYSLQP